MDTAYWLFSQMKTTGSRQMEARLSASWKAPWFEAPSPKKHRQTRFVPRSCWASAMPLAMGMPAPTMPLAPQMPREKSAMCMEPPRPRQ